jgi:uncharacterized protein
MKIIILVPIALILISFLLTRFLEKRILFRPLRLVVNTPQSVGLEYEEVFFKSFDDVRLNGWFIPAKGALLTILYFHGNAGNISHRIEVARAFNSQKFNFFIFDYRGFGKSKGSPSEEGTYLDGIAAYNYLINEKNILPKNIVLYGKSLGAAVAVNTAIKVKAGVLICESSFASTKDMVKEFYGLIPLWTFISQRYDTLEKIRRVDIPLLVMHSPKDEIIPFRHSKRLFKKAREPKELYIMKGGHNDAFYIYKTEIMKRMEDFLIKYSKQPNNL